MTTLWRYTAIPLPHKDAPRSQPERGELAADSAAEARASLRRLGLRVLDLRELRGQATRSDTWPAWSRPVIERWHRHLATRRATLKADALDALATLLEAGIPITDATRTLSQAAARRRSTRLMLVRLHEDLKAGHAFPDAMRRQPAWFDAVEVAMLQAGEHADLARTLRTLAQRHARAGELTSKLIGALAYPCVVLMVALGVTVFLSTRTLPPLVAILEQAKVPTPTLTRGVMAFGQLLVRGWVWILLTVVAGAVAISLAPRLLRRHTDPSLHSSHRPSHDPSSLSHANTGRGAAPRSFVPRVIRRVALAHAFMGLAELLRTGVPLTDSLRLIAPSVSGPLGASLASALTTAAARIERGEDPSDALDDPRWFDPECKQMLRVAEASGELAPMLQRLGEHAERTARRSIDRLVALLEPAVILILAGLVGLVVMAAVLPMLRLQEIIQ